MEKRIKKANNVNNRDGKVLKNYPVFFCFNKYPRGLYIVYMCIVYVDTLYMRGIYEIYGGIWGIWGVYIIYMGVPQN